MKTKHALIMSTSLLATIPLSFAQEVLEPTTLSAVSLDGKVDNSVSAEDLEYAQAVDLNDVFQKTPSVQVNGGRAQAQQIFVNGLESTLSNVTIDGATQGNLYHHAGSVFVDPELLKQVNVYAGAGNALQGLGALNGAVEFKTKNAFDLLEDGKDFYNISKGTYYSNGEGFKLSNTTAGRLNSQWAALFSASYTDRDSYDDGDGDEVELTDYETRNLLLKLSGRFDGGHSLDLGFEHYLSETVSFDRINVTEEFLLNSGRPTGTLQPIELARDTFTLNYNYKPSGDDLIDLDVNAYYSTQGYERTTSGDEIDLDTVGVDIQNRSEFNESFALTYGVNFRRTETDLTYAPPFAFTGSEDEVAYGLFAQADWEVNKILSFSVGGRYDHYDYDDIGGQNFDSGEFSPNASVTLKPVEGLSLNLGYNEAYRGVGIREAFLPGSRPVDLDGEEAQTVKFTAAYENGGFFTRASYFDQSIDNYIYPVGSRGTGSEGDIKNEGYEILVGYQTGNFRTSLAVSDSSPGVEDYEFADDFGLVVSGRRWVADASYNFEEHGLIVGGNIEFRESVSEVESSFTDFPSIAAKDSYTLVNAYLKWSVPSVEGLTLALNVDNLFDEDYQDHTIFTASGLASPGREFRIGASYEF